MAIDLNQKSFVKLDNRSSGFNFEANRAKLNEQAEARRLAAEERAKAEALAFPTEEPTEVKKSFQEKILSFTGGNILGRGLGLGLAQGATKETMDEIQQGEGEMQQRLIAAIQKNKAEGKDTTRLTEALKALTGGIEETGNQANDLYTEGITSKQVVGDAAQLALTAGAGYSAGAKSGQLTAGKLGTKALSKVGVTAAPKTAPALVSGIASQTSVLGGIGKGALKGGLSGAGFGAGTGFTQGLKEDKSISDSLKQAGVGAVTGGIAGGVIGGAVGGVSGAISKIKARGSNPDSFVDDLVSPKATEKVKSQALQEGRVSEQGFLKSAKILPSKRDKQLAEAVKDVVSPKKSPTQNLNAIRTKVDEINTGVKAYVKANKTPFNTNQLKTQLNKGKNELNLVFASDKQAEKTYDAVVKEFLKHVGKKDTAGLLQARQEFDRIPAIKKLLDSQGLGENTKKEVVLTVRSMVNKYVADLLPAGNEFRANLLQESKMIEALGNIADKNTGLIDANKLQILTKKYPILKWVASGLVGAGGVGIGSTIIGSSD